MGRRFARGKKARAICQRSGFEIPYRYLVEEPGTNLWVDRRWSDGNWNLVDHPQNYPPDDLDDEAPLEKPTGGTEFPPELSAGTLFEVSLPDGDGIIVSEELSSTTTVPLINSSCRVILADASTTLLGSFNSLFYCSFQKI